jgi:all-trans-retinol 13,14-reductase
VLKNTMKRVVVIGSGLGGLTAGALLAKDGYRVTLLEQHNIVGGCATTFKRGDFICEVGLHEMDGVYTNSQIKEIFTKLDVYKNVEFIKVPEFFKTALKDDIFTMPDGIENAIEALIQKFPKEKDSIAEYFKLMETISLAYENLQNMKWYHYAFFPFYFSSVLRYKDKTVTEVFNRLFSDEKLKLLLNSNVQYYSDTPDKLSFLLHSLAQYSYYRGGGYFIKGGSGRLSDYLASTIKQNGGEVITRADVVECSENSVTYIRRGERVVLDADMIISNLSFETTYNLFNHRYIETKEIADSILTIYIGFSKNLKSHYGKGAYSNFIYDDIDNLDEYNKMLKKDISSRGFVFVDYSQIDSQLTKRDDKSFGAICMVDYLSEWNRVLDEDYREKKLSLERAVIKRLENYYPNISDYIEYIETGTSRTLKRYIKTPNATAYGFKATPKQFFRVPKVKSNRVKNLYFVGQWVIAGGFSPAINSGYICYKKIKRDIE